MATKSRKTKRANLAESNSDDDSDFENNATRPSSLQRQKKKYQKTINSLCDNTSSSDEEREPVSKNRPMFSSKNSGAKSKTNVVYVDINSSSDSDSKNQMSKSKQNKKSTTRGNKKVKSESDSESLEVMKDSKKTQKSSCKKESTSKSRNKSRNDSLGNDPSSSKDFQRSKLKNDKTLNESFEKYNFIDYSNVTTPSRMNEENTIVETAQEISFKHYVIQEIKKFQQANNKLQDDLDLSNKYLLKKKIGSIKDAKFFIHKILKIHQDTFDKLKENRREFLKIYDSWMDDVSKTSTKESEKRFNLSSEESDNVEMPNEVTSPMTTKNVEPTKKVSRKISKDDSIVDEPAEESDDSIFKELTKLPEKIKKQSAVKKKLNKSKETGSTDQSEKNDKPATTVSQTSNNESFDDEAVEESDESFEDCFSTEKVEKQSSVERKLNKSKEIVKNGHANESSEDEPSLKEKNKRKLRLDDSLVSNKNKSASSAKAVEESDDDDSPMEVSECDSEDIFSSEESKAKRNIEKEKNKRAKEDKAKKSPEKPAAVTIQRTPSPSVDSEDLFDTSVDTVPQEQSEALTSKSVDKENDPLNVQEPMDELFLDVEDKSDVVEEKSQTLSLRMSVDEENEPINVLDWTDEQLNLEVQSENPKSALDANERQALKRLLQDDSDVNTDSERDETDKETDTEENNPSAREKKKILTKQAKKIRLVSCSDSSSSSSGVREALSQRRRRKKSAAALRTATERGDDTFDLRLNRHYRANEKLRQTCKVVLERLPTRQLVIHVEALKKSKKYVEYKKIQSLANLDNLQSKKKSKKNSNATESSESDADNAKEPQKNQNAKEEKSSIADHLGKNSNETDSDSSDENDEVENHSFVADPDELLPQTSIQDAETMAKETLLHSSSSSSSDELVENEMELDDDDNDDDSKKKNEQVNDKNKKEDKKANTENDDSSEEKTDQTKDDEDKGAWKKDKLLTFNLDGSETEDEKFTKSQEKKKAKQSEAENDKSQESPSAIPPKKTKSTKKTRKARRIVDSDSDVQSISNDEDEKSSKDESEEDEEETEDKDNKKKRQRGEKSSDSESSSSGKKQKAKRRRIKKVASDSDSDDKDSPGKGRKNIRKVLKDKYVTDDTRKAAQDEEERLRRIAERQKLFNDIYEQRLAGEEKVDRLVLDIDEETKEELVVVDEELAKRLKPHQARGIKFMWDACFESIEQLETSEGSGCIIAHCMGLGKTFQVVTLAHTLLSNEKTKVRTVMVVCPLSTVLNWVNEFNIWLKHTKNPDAIEIYEMTKLKKNIERKNKLECWQKYGGVLIIGYEMFRNLTSTGKKMRKNMQESITRSLVDPGADIVVCDEGHLLKNEDSALSKAMKLVKTLRRVVLTGTPLQNNLKEYHCMVQFVKPNLLGTKKEFLNRFVNPITNGQFDDSTDYDVKLMKKRAHVLHKMLEGSVQRFDYSVLTPFLPPKQECVIFVRLTEVQQKLYQHYLDNYSRRFGGRNVSLFADFQSLQRIWTHPYVLHLNAEKVEKANEKKRLEASDSEGSLKDFIDDDSTSVSEVSSISSNGSSDVECLDSDSEKGSGAKKRATRANPVKEEEQPEQAEEAVEEAAWWTEFVDEEQFNDLRGSTKLMLLFAILKESESIGDKVLVFSQSLYSLTLIEHFLNLMDEQNQTDGDAEKLNGHTGTWSLGMDYFRLDGSTSAENRSIWSKIFNNPKNTRARLFLISTRAGGLGINLIGANRVIIFDASWNPSHDVQSIFRIYRFGQKKPCYVYRFLAAGTMEEKIYNRQVTKLSLACRVVDEQQIERHYSNTDLAELYQFDTCEEQNDTLALPKDRLLAEIFSKYKKLIVKCHEHDSLLENKEEEELDEEERKQAWAEYEEEKKGIRQQGYNMGNNFAVNQMMMSMSTMPEFQGVKQLLQKDYPDVPPEHLDVIARQAMFDMYRQIDQQAVLNPLNNFGNPLTMPAQNTLGNPSFQSEIFRQQNIMMNQGQPNLYYVNQKPAYSGRGRPPKFTSVNNQIVSNPMYLGSYASSLNAQSNDNDVQVLEDVPVTSSSKQTTSNEKN